MSTSPEAVRDDRDQDHDPMFHLVEDDEPYALCGHRFSPFAHEYPLHQGPYDCPECWRIAEQLGWFS